MATFDFIRNVNVQVAPPTRFLPSSTGVALAAGLHNAAITVDTSNMQAADALDYVVQWQYDSVDGQGVAWHDGQGSTILPGPYTHHNGTSDSLYAIALSIPQAPYYPAAVRFTITRNTRQQRFTVTGEVT